MTYTTDVYIIIIKHIRAKPSALSQNLRQLLARMRRCVRVILSTRAQLTSYLGAGRGREFEGKRYLA